MVQGPASFPKESRCQLKHAHSPGPAYYSPEKPRSKPAGGALPKEKRKFFSCTSSPGPSPNIYYPSMHYVSKK